MKAKIIVALIIVMAVFTGCGSSSESKRQTDVRNACWGDSIEKVEKLEDGTLLTKNKDTLRYYVDLYGCDATLSYCFDKDYGLREAIYNIDGISSSQLYRKYKILVNNLEQKYGESEHSEVNWDIKNDYSNRPELGLSKGYLTLYDDWKYLNRTNISLRIGNASKTEVDVVLMCRFSSAERDQETT